jgi:hypothetical protein
VLFYLIRNDLHTISYSLIEEISEMFVKNLSILNFFSEKYKESYKNSCISVLKKYINQPKNEIIEDILLQTHRPVQGESAKGQRDDQQGGEAGDDPASDGPIIDVHVFIILFFCLFYDLSLELFAMPEEVCIAGGTFRK